MKKIMTKDGIRFVAFTIIGISLIDIADGNFSGIILGCSIIVIGLAGLLGNDKVKVDVKQEKE